MREAHYPRNPDSEESMSTPETTSPEAPAMAEPQDEIVRRFLGLSAAYLCSCTYRARLRAAFARQGATNPIDESALRYQERIADEAFDLLRAEWEQKAAAWVGTSTQGCHENVTRAA